MVDVDRNALFDELLAKALDDAEVTAALEQEGAPSRDLLESEAQERRDQFLGQVQSAEHEYNDAVAYRGSRRFTRGGVLGGVVVLLMLFSGVLLAFWKGELDEGFAVAPHPTPWSWTVVGNALGMTTLVLSIIGLSVIVMWGAVNLLPRWRTPENRRMNLGVLCGTHLFWLGVLVVILYATSMSDIVWQLDHRRPADGQPFNRWGTSAMIGSAVVYTVAAVPFGRRLAAELARLIVGDGGGEGPEERLASWREALSEALLSFLRGEISERVTRRYGTSLTLLDDSKGLRQVRGTSVHVSTPAGRQLAAMAAGMDNGSIALSGPRGVGKTTLLTAFCEGDPHVRAGLVMHVPVVFDQREFMLHLFDRVCTLAINENLDSRGEARKRQEWIRYLQTRADEVTTGFGWKGFTLGGKRGVSRARQPLTHPEIVDRLRRFLARVGREVRGQGRRLIIGLDELDRIEPPHRTRDFLNEVKAVFDVPDCLFVLSVSDEALREADLARPGRRDMFDSAVDEVIRVEPLGYPDAVRLLGTRAIGLPEPFVALFHCLSGGMPRDLLRTARAAVSQTSPERPRTLAETAAYLVGRDLDRGLDEVAPESHALFRDTLLHVFGEALTHEQMDLATDPDFPGSFDALAAVQRGLTDAGANVTVDIGTIRQAWGLPVAGAPNGTARSGASSAPRP